MREIPVGKRVGRGGIRNQFRLGPLFDGPGRLVAILLADDRLGLLHLGEVAAENPLLQRTVVGEVVLLLGLAGLFHQFLLHAAQLTDHPLALVDRLEHAGLGHLAGKSLDHQHRVFVA